MPLNTAAPVGARITVWPSRIVFARSPRGSRLPSGFLQTAIITFVRFYQRVASVRLRRSCRFEPSCSEYLILAVQKHGALGGLMRGFSRLMRCRPPYGGVDNL